MKYQKIKYKRYCIGIYYEESEKIISGNFFKPPPPSHKKARYIDDPGEGYVIGDCYKYEGVYSPGYHDEFEGEQAILVSRKRINFHKVLIGFNQVVLVNKKDIRRNHGKGKNNS